MRLSSQRLWFLIGLILLLAGLDIAVTLSHTAKWIGLILMTLGLGVLVFNAREKPKKEEEKEEKSPKEKKLDEKITLADKLIIIITINGRIKLMLPILGAFLIIFVYAFNFFFREGFELGVNDTITILLGATMMLYNYIPDRFNRERDFVFLFFVFLFLILVLPLTIYSIISGPIPEMPNSPFIYWLLAKPTSDMLNFVGIESLVQASADSGVWIEYKNVDNSWNSVGIGLSCTGLYSVSIFISGFISFILLEYRRFDIRVASLLTLGVFTSWFANILRMTIIVAVGSNYGSDALYWTHENLGIFIFMLWVGLFWGLMFRLLVPKGKKEGEEEESPEKKTKEHAQKSEELDKSSSETIEG